MNRLWLSFVFAMATTFLFAATTASGAVVNVAGPVTVRSGFLKKTTTTVPFAARANVPGQIVIVNGNGMDLSPKTCAGNLLQKLACSLENLAKQVVAVLDRPDSVEVSLNGAVIATSAQLKQTMPGLSLNVNLKASNQLVIKVGSLPTQTLTATIKQEAALPNQLPIANFSAVPLTGTVPLVVSFNGTLSTDSDGTITDYFWDFGDGSNGRGLAVTHTYPNAGNYSVVLTVTDNQGGQSSQTQVVQVLPAPIPPVITLSSPSNGQELTSLTVSVAGTADKTISQVTAQFDGQAAVNLSLSSNRRNFSGSVTANAYGARTLTIRAFDSAGTTGTVVLNLNFLENRAPTAALAATSPVTGVAPLTVSFDASGSSDPDNDALNYSFDFGDGVVTTPDSNPLTNHEFVNPGHYVVTVTVRDGRGGESQAQLNIDATEAFVPAAPLLARSPGIPFEEQVAPLYIGPDAIQSNVAPDSIAPATMSVVSGVVLDQSGQPLSGVIVGALEQPEVGLTATRADGQFDLVVNGGRKVTMNFARNGYFQVQRAMMTSENAFAMVDPVVMIRPDVRVSVLRMNASTFQVARGSTLSDAAGVRAGVLGLPSGTKAQLKMADGSLRSVTQLSFRISEYTGLDRIPGLMPNSSSFDYAVEVSADEAIALGAKSILFSQLVPFYVNNFSNLPVGSSVPLSIYNRVEGTWEVKVSGVIAQVLAVKEGRAQLDVDGTGRAANPVRLAELGISEEEQRALAQLYSEGQSFWRVRTNHLSPLAL